MAKRKDFPPLDEADAQLFFDLLRASLEEDPYINPHHQKRKSARVAKSKVKPRVLTLKIALDNVSKPPVWRRVKVSSMWNFVDLHEIIQRAFGWMDEHLAHFGNDAYGDPYDMIEVTLDKSDDCEGQDGSEILIGQALNKVGQKFKYVYDFGDDWIHTLTVEEIEDGDIVHAELVKGSGMCPPEDCGGPWGWKELRDSALNADLNDEDLMERLEWCELLDDEGKPLTNFKDFDIDFHREMLADLPRKG